VDPTDQGATLAAPQVQPPVATLPVGISTPPAPTDDVAQQRATKAAIGVGQVIDQSADDIYKKISAGQEDSVRANAATELNYQQILKRNEVVQNLSAMKGGALSLTELNQVLDQTQPNAQANNVVEKSFSQNYVEPTLTAAAARQGNDTILDAAKSDDPAAVDAYINQGTQLSTRREVALKAVQDLQPAIDQSALLNFHVPGFEGQFRPSMFDIENALTLGIPSSYMLRGNTENATRFSGLGTALDDQAKELLTLPSDNEFTDKFHAIIKNLQATDPGVAAQFAQAVYGMSSSDKFIASGGEALNAALTIGGAIGGKAAIEAAGRASVRNMGKLIEGSDGVFRPAGEAPSSGALVPVNQVQKAVNDVVKSGEIKQITKATAAEGAGDTAEAGVQKTITSTVNPDPEKDAWDTLSRNFKSDVRETEDNPGPNLSREQHTRLLDATQSFMEDTKNTILDSYKVVRNPELLEDGFRAIMPAIEEYYPGAGNMVLDIDHRFEPFSNTNFMDMKLGDYNGDLLPSVQTAVNRARNIGIGNPIIGSNANGNVKEGQFYLPAHAVVIPDYSDSKATGPKYKPNPNFGHKEINGEHYFYSDLANGVTVSHGVTPRAGDISVDVSSGKPVFGKNILDSETARVEQQGLGFYIVKPVPVNETDPLVRAQIATTPKGQSMSNQNVPKWRSVPNGTAMLSYLRNPDDTLSRYSVENRKKVAYGQGKYVDLIKGQMKYIEAVSKGNLKYDPETGLLQSAFVDKPLSYVGKVTGKNKIVFDQFKRVLTLAQTMKDPDTGLPGYFFKNPAELSNFYQTNFSRPPTFAEQQAYRSFRDLYGLDLMLRDLAQFKFKARLGAEQYTYYTSTDGQRTASPTFEAVRLKSLRNPEDATLIHDASGAERWFHNMNPKDQQEIRRRVQTGELTMVEILDTDQLPLKKQDIQGNQLRVRYVLSNAFEATPLSFAQTPRRGGGHIVYDYDHYVKEPIMTKQFLGGREQNIYLGDATYMPIDSKAKGEDFAMRMNTLKGFMRKRQTKAAEAYAKQFIDIPWKTLRRDFYQTKDTITGAINPPRINMHVDTRVVPSGGSIHGLDDKLETSFKPGTFIDGTKHGSLIRNFQTEYTGQRDSYDLFTVDNKGSIYNPFYQYRPADIVDPLVSLNNAMRRIVNSSMMDDYKISESERWVKENAALLDYKPSEIASSPFRVMNNPKFKKDAPLAQVWNAQANLYKVKKFIGIPSTYDTVVQDVKQNLADGIYEAPWVNNTLVVAGRIDKALGLSKNKYLSTTGLVRGPLLIPEWAVHNSLSPVDLATAFTHHAYLGLWNVSQLMIQQSNWVTMAALEPEHITQAAYGSFVHQWTRINDSPAFVDFLDKTATNFGWKTGEWKEARQELLASSFDHVGQEHSLITSDNPNYFFKSDWRLALDTGTIPFNEGERNVRFGAWYLAFHEFRTKNPNVKLGQAERGQILARADDLYGNMSKASNSLVNQGVLRIPAQFLSFLYRLTEVFWSKRIGPTVTNRVWARARMLLIYGLLFGGYNATSLTGVPIGDFMRKHAIDQGYVIGKNAMETFWEEGGLSFLGAYITGKGDFQKGNWYNFNNKIGANGLGVLKDLFRGDETVWKVLGGASGSAVGNAIAATDGFMKSAYSMMVGAQGDEAFPMKLDDWIEMAKIASTAKLADRLYYAYQFHKWIDTHGQAIHDVSMADAVWMALTGLSHQQSDDRFLKGWDKHDEDANTTKGTQGYFYNKRLAEQAAANGDVEQANDFNRRAFRELTWYGVPKEKWGQIIAQGARDYRDLIDQGDEKYYRRFVAEPRKDVAGEAYKATKQIEDKSKP